MKDTYLFNGMTPRQVQYTLDLLDDLIASYRSHTSTLKESSANLERSCLLWKAINIFQDGLQYRIFNFWPFVPKFVVEFDRRIEGLRKNDELSEALKEIGKEIEAW